MTGRAPMRLSDLPPEVKLNILRRLDGDNVDGGNGLDRMCGSSSQLSSHVLYSPTATLSHIATLPNSSTLPVSVLETLFADGLAVHDSFLPTSLYQECSTALESAQIDMAIGKLNQINGESWSEDSIRGDVIRFIKSQDSSIPDCIHRVRECLEDVAKQIGFGAGLDLGPIEIQLAHYAGNGTGYKPHVDSTETVAPNRTVTAVLYLNQDMWTPSDGGCLRAHLISGHRDIRPVGNRLVLFMSKWLLHEVLPVFSSRFAMSAFIHC